MRDGIAASRERGHGFQQIIKQLVVLDYFGKFKERFPSNRNGTASISDKGSKGLTPYRALRCRGKLFSVISVTSVPSYIGSHQFRFQPENCKFKIYVQRNF